MHAFIEILRNYKIAPGTVVEAGAGSGNSALQLQNYFLEIGEVDREFWFFDSFQGFPEPSEIDLASKRAPRKGEWNIRKEVFEKTILSSTTYHIVEGFVEDTIPSKYTGGGIAILHLDLDLYSGYKHCLEHLHLHIIPGGFIFLDEYDEKYPDGSVKWPGAKKAIDEFVEKYGLEHRFFNYSNGKAYMKF